MTLDPAPTTIAGSTVPSSWRAEERAGPPAASGPGGSTGDMRHCPPPDGRSGGASYTPAVTPLPRRDAILLLAVLGTGVFLAGLELMITAVALPAIVTDLATWTRLREASWIINGYLLVYIVTMPVAGRLADLYGARRLFLGALVVFTLGSLVAGAAPSLELLIVARLLQAVGGGALVPVATAAASHLFPGASRPRALGFVGAHDVPGHGGGTVPRRRDPRLVPPGGRAVAPRPRAGLAAEQLLAPAWRWVFYVNVPVGIVALVIAWAASSGWETPTPRRPGRPPGRRAVLRVPPRRARGAHPARRARDRRTAASIPPLVSAVLAGVAVVALRAGGRPRPPGPRPVPGPAAVPLRLVLVCRHRVAG